MSEARVDEQMLRKYLLGALDDQETARLDELIVTDDDVAEQLRAVENELVDSYVRGELSGDAVARFKSHYLAAPGHREKIKMAQAFLTFFNPALRRGAAPAASKHEWRLRPQWLAVAAVLVMLLSAYLLFENIRLRNHIQQKQAEFESLSQRERELQNQLDRHPAAVSEIEKELAGLREKLAQLEKQAGPKQDVKQIAFHLSPPTRAISAIPIVEIPAGIDFVILNVQMEAGGFDSYRAKLKYAENSNDLWISGTLGRRDDILQVRMPAAVLKTQQNYLLEVSGIPAGGDEEILTGYPFRVVTSIR